MRRRHLIGWLVISGAGRAEEVAAKVSRGLNAFVGDFGSIRVTDIRDGFGFGFWKPEMPLPMTTWSTFGDARSVCFLEGVFYDDFGSHRIAEGEDAGLARAVAESVALEGEAALARLTGSFAGFVFDLKTRRLTTFVDRIATRTLYWTESKDGVIVSSNLAAFRSLIRPRLDAASAFQFVTIGFPIGERTLLDGVFAQSPGTVSVFSTGSRRAFRYWTPPPRNESLSLRDAVCRIAESMEDCIARMGRRSGGGFGLGLTGGHDSRLILGSLLYEKVPFEVVSWRDHNFNDRVVPELCARAKKEPHFVADSSPEELREIQRETFAYTDGQHLHAYGYTWLGRQCSREGLDTLILGFIGDYLSGSPGMHLHVRSLRELAGRALEEQMELLSFPDAEALLRETTAGIRDETMSLWMKSFENEEWRGTISDIYLWQGLRNRSVKRVRHAMNPALQYVQVVYPYLDNEVMDTYLSLPVKFLNQKPHCYAGFYRFPEFGDLPAMGFPISLRKEALFPVGIYLLRLATANVRALRSRFLSAPDRSAWSQADELVYKEVAGSPLFDSRRLDEFVAHRRIKLRDLRKMQTLSRFHDFYVREDETSVPRPYLAR